MAEATQSTLPLDWKSVRNGDVAGGAIGGGRIHAFRHSAIETGVRSILQVVGEDPDRDGLKDTPRRVAKMYLDELCSGYHVDIASLFTTFESGGYDAAVIVKNIP